MNLNYTFQNILADNFWRNPINNDSATLCQQTRHDRYRNLRKEK